MDTLRELSLKPQQYQKESFCFPYSDPWAFLLNSKMLVLPKRSYEAYIKQSKLWVDKLIFSLLSYENEMQKLNKQPE